MPEHKSHHYVPQMYMRLFAGADAKRVGIYVIKTRRLIRHAPIRGQLCRDYFYGRNPRAEKALGRIEDHASRIFMEAVDLGQLPVMGSQAHEWLILYLGLQHARTVAAADQHNVQSEKLAKALLRRKAELEGNSEILAALASVRIRRTNAVSEVMGYATVGASLLADLRFILIRNKSGTPFISSDTPLVLHNRLFENQPIDVTGYANVGLQLFLPLGPRLMLFGFDGAAYAVARNSDGAMHLSDPAQVRLLNDLQWESASSVMLVSPDADEAALHASAASWFERRTVDRGIFHEEIVEQSVTEVRTRHGSGRLPSTIALALDGVVPTLPSPAPLQPYEIPPFRDQQRVERADRAFEGLKAWEREQREI